MSASSVDAKFFFQDEQDLKVASIAGFLLAFTCSYVFILVKGGRSLEIDTKSFGVWI